MPSLIGTLEGSMAEEVEAEIEDEEEPVVGE